jgi:Tol biopolymer transport system component
MRRPVTLAAAAILVLLGATSALSSPGTTTRVNVASDGTQANYHADGPQVSLSSDGRHVAFSSAASNLAVGDTNGQSDAFVRDRVTGVTERVSVASDGTQGNGSSEHPAISADGRFVAFRSGATNLVPGDTNSFLDFFVRDRVAGTTERVSLANDGSQANGPTPQIPFISADGRFVVFVSYATNLVPGDTNNKPDVFVRDRLSGTTERVSVASDATQGDGDSGNATPITPDGRFVAFDSASTNLVPGDTNGWRDIFVRDRLTGTTERVSLAGDGSQGNGFSDRPAISSDGRYVAFLSSASNLVAGDTSGDDVFVRDRLAGTTERVNIASDETQANAGGSGDAAEISADGRYVVFGSFASNLVPGDTNSFVDIFLRDRLSGTTERVSVASDGTQGNGASDYPAINADGDFIAFHSEAYNLVSGDTNGFADIFVHARASMAFVFSGFFAPVDNPPTINKANAGQTIPIKWRLTDQNGVPVSDPASFVSVTSGSTTCNPSDPIDAIEAYSGSSGLQYLGDGNWQFNWTTPNGYAGQCRIMRLNLSDGSTDHVAHFQFK